jgi:hypothetical protein
MHFEQRYNRQVIHRVWSFAAVDLSLKTMRSKKRIYDEAKGLKRGVSRLRVSCEHRDDMSPHGARKETITEPDTEAARPC